MKKLLSKKDISVLAAVLFFGVALTARAENSAMKSGDGSGWDKGGWEDTCAKSCDLSDSQKEKLKAIFAKQRETTQAMVDQIKIDMDTLKLNVDAKAGDDTIGALLDKIDAEKEKLATQRDGFEDQLDDTLTRTQQAKLLLAKSGHRKWSRMGDGKQKDGDSMNHAASPADSK